MLPLTIKHRPQLVIARIFLTVDILSMSNRPLITPSSFNDGTITGYWVLKSQGPWIGENFLSLFRIILSPPSQGIRDRIYCYIFYLMVIICYMKKLSLQKYIIYSYRRNPIALFFKKIIGQSLIDYPIFTRNQIPCEHCATYVFISFYKNISNCHITGFLS